MRECQTNTTSAAGVGKYFLSNPIAVFAAAAVRLSPTRYTLRELAVHPLHHTHRKLVMVGLEPDTAETEGQERCGRSLARVSVADAASIALNFPVITGE